MPDVIAGCGTSVVKLIGPTGVDPPPLLVTVTDQLYVAFHSMLLRGIVQYGLVMVPEVAGAGQVCPGADSQVTVKL
jgi:hypothetical protein